MPSFLPLGGRAHSAKRALIASVGLSLVALVADFQQWTLTRAIWHASHPASGPRSRRQRKQPGRISGWWLTFPPSGLAGRVRTSLRNAASDPDRVRQAAVVLLVADVLSIVAGVLAVIFV